MSSLELSFSRDEATDLLQTLIRAPSPTPPGETKACAEIISLWLDRENIPFKTFEPQPGMISLKAELAGGSGQGPALLLNGHLDTVPPGRGWAVPPLEGRLSDGHIHGRGAVDMKGGLAAALAALVSLKRAGAPFKGRLILTAVADEENHGQWGTKYLLNQGLLRAEAAVCCEPTNLALELGNRGLVMIDVFIRGRASHAGRPGLGLNAVNLAAKVVRAIEDFQPGGPPNPRFEISRGGCTVVGIRGGARQNLVPDGCLVHLDRRLMPGQTGPWAVTELTELIGRTLETEVETLDPEADFPSPARVCLRPEYWHEPFWTPEDSPWAALARQTLTRLLGAPPLIRGKAAGTDASHLVSLGGIPSIIFGPGDSQLSHTVDEKIAVADIIKAAESYQALALDFFEDWNE